MKFGLIGTNWGQNYIRTIYGMAEHQLTHIATSKTYPITYAGNAVQINDWQKVVRSDCDAIIIASPPSTHREILEQCIETGKPTIVEKPACVYYNDTKHLYEKSLCKNVPVLVNHIHLWNPKHELLKRIVKEEKFESSFTYSEGGNWGPFRSDVSAVYDWLPHDFSLIIDAIGPIESLKSNFGGEYNDVFSISTKHHGGSGWIYSGRALPEKRRIFYVQDSNSNIIKWDDRDKAYIKFSEKLVPVTKTISPLENMLKYFTSALNDGDIERMGMSLAVEISKNIEKSIVQLQ